MTKSKTAAPLVPPVITESAVETNEESAKLFKKVVATAVSTIMYYRGIFDEKDYGPTEVGDVQTYVLCNKGGKPQKNDLLRVLKSVFEALEKKFAKQIIVGFHEKEKENTNFFEAYSFKFTYGNGERKDSEELVEEFSNMIGEIKRLAQSAKPLDKEPYVAVHMAYNDNAPFGYNPDGFKSLKLDPEFSFVGEMKTTTAENVAAPFHTVRIKTVYARDSQPSDEED